MRQAYGAGESPIVGSEMKTDCPQPRVLQLEKEGIGNVGCKSAGNRRNDAAAVQMAYGIDAEV